jgi:subtilisin family serine protease
MTDVVMSLATLAGCTARGVRVAVVDSGVHASHPHVNGVAGGVGIDDEGRPTGDFTDRLGHGTAVAAAIREKAPHAELLAVKVFDRALRTTGPALVAGIRWAARQRAAIVNLSLGTANAEHESALSEAVHEAAEQGSIVVAAGPDGTTRWLPGALAGVVAVELDWDCPRDECRMSVSAEGRITVRASGYPRPIPGVPVERNDRGQSLAVANASGLIALLVEDRHLASLSHLTERVFGSRG